MTAPVFQSLTKSIAKDVRSKTLELYKSLLRSSKHFEGQDILTNQIRSVFKANKHTLSRKKLAQQIEQGSKAQECLSKALDGNEKMLECVQRFVSQHKMKKKHSNITKTKGKKAASKRKVYQVAIESKTAAGYTFKRVRGWVQPVGTSMMLKKRVVQKQKSLDRFQYFQQQFEWMKNEQSFLSQLGIQDTLADYMENIKIGMDIEKKKVKI